MTDPRPHPAIPRQTDRETLNAALHADNIETGFYDDNGRPAPWPDDIDQWRPETSKLTPHQPGEQPF
jgi:hypothetical protein